MAQRGIAVDHPTVHRWAIKLLPVLEKAFRHCKRADGKSWRMDETYVKIRGEWRCLYRAVDKEGTRSTFFCELGCPVLFRKIDPAKRRIRDGDNRQKRSQSGRAARCERRMRHTYQDSSVQVSEQRR